MAHITEDRILESSTTTGTGNMTLAGAVTGFRRFSAVCAVSDTVDYLIEVIDSVGQPTGDYEYGTGTYSSANTLTRTTVLGSSNAGFAVGFAAGTKNVAICVQARRLTLHTTQNLIASRALATTYTNTTGRPIFVHVRCVTSSTGASSISFAVNGISMSGTTISANGAGIHMGALVPPGATYSAALSGAGALTEWVEVR